MWESDSLTATLRAAGFQMYFGEAMWVVLNVVEPGARNHIQDAVEQEVRGIQAAIQGGGYRAGFLNTCCALLLMKAPIAAAAETRGAPARGSDWLVFAHEAGNPGKLRTLVHQKNGAVDVVCFTGSKMRVSTGH
jgi:hypothetical protein